MLKHVAEIELDDDTGIDTRVEPLVRIINGALDEDDTGIVLNGRIDPRTLRFLKVDQTYQRPLGDRSDIWTALKDGTLVPNIDVGVRGNTYDMDGDDYLIRDPAYIIDGWQRVGTALRILDQNPNHPIRIFASVHFGSTDIWERHRFTELNKNVRKVSPNLHLRNMRDSNEAVLTLYGLSNNTKDFALYKKVCWSQNMHRDELVPALLIAKIAYALHNHKGGAKNQTVTGISEAIIRQAAAVSLSNFRKNIATFFDVIDGCWGIRSIEYRNAAPQIKGNFMWALASVFSGHVDFWDAGGRLLFVSADHRRKLKSFPIRDPQVIAMTAAGGASVRKLIVQLIVNHMNSGKRTNRLRSRHEAQP